MLKTSLPQIAYITKISKSNSIRINKTLSEFLHLGTPPKLKITFNGEFLLWNSDDLGNIISDNIRTYEIDMKAGNFYLPDEIAEKMEIKPSDNLAFIERRIALALKKVEFKIQQSPDAYSQVVDSETSTSLIREIQTIPPINELLLKLSKKYKNPKFKHDFNNYISNKSTFACWYARQITGNIEEGDEEIRKTRIRDIFNTQHADGSWGNIPITARNLRELADLKVSPDSSEVKKGVSWLFNRPESEYNPGMFFLEDSMVEEQKDVINKRRKPGKHPRFRKRKKRYERLIAEGDGISLGGCGPQIIWPNALVLEALLKLGYNEHPRIQRIYETLTKSIHWCDCGYQHGTSDWVTQNQITNFEEIEYEAKIQAMNAGLTKSEDILKWHQSKTKFKHQKRLERIDKHQYLVQPLRTIEGCGAITTRALNYSKNENIRSLAKSVLWHCVTMQGFMGRFEDIDRGRLGDFSTLSTFAEWDHPAAKLMILRSIPWLIESQNIAGSWGTEGKEDYTTLTVIKALKNAELI